MCFVAQMVSSIAQLNFFYLKYCNENRINFKEDCKNYSTRAHYLQFNLRTGNENSPEKTPFNSKFSYNYIFIFRR